MFKYCIIITTYPKEFGNPRSFVKKSTAVKKRSGMLEFTAEDIIKSTGELDPNLNVVNLFSQVLKQKID